MNKEPNTPNGKSIFTPIENNCYSSPDNYHKFNNNYIQFQNFMDFSNNNYINNYHKKLFEDCHKMPFNLNRENGNIPTPKKDNLLTEIAKKEKNEINNNNITKKFFTDYGGYGYKCSCSKTNCNRYYCECFR